MKQRGSTSVSQPDAAGAPAMPGRRAGSRRRGTKRAKLRVGWREWAALPDLGIPAIKAKLDTGARTSALHVSHVRWHDVDGKDWVEFDAHPIQHDETVTHRCWARAVDRRWVTNPGGRREKRFVIKTRIEVGGRTWPIELSLTNRDDMGFRLLLGRGAMQRRVVLDPNLSYHTGRRKESPTPAAVTAGRAPHKRRRRSDEEE